MAVTFWLLYSKSQRKEITGAVASVTVTMAQEANNSLEHMVLVSTADRVKELNDLDVTEENIASAKSKAEALRGITTRAD